jgi:hypothetical protein
VKQRQTGDHEGSRETSQSGVKSKQAFEKFAVTHGVYNKHYHADNSRFKDNLFMKT